MLLVLDSLEKRFGATVALDGLDLEVERGEFIALLGGSGSGKSTLLRLVAGFETPDAGRILLDGADITALPPQARPCAMVFQSYALFPHMTVFDNVAYGLRREKVAPPEIAQRVAEALAMVGLEGVTQRKPHQLSGGQRQRVALVRALVKRPPLLLLDEPMGALDAGLRERTGLELRALQRATGATFVMVTHDQAEALALADRVAVLANGRLEQIGTPQDLYEQPTTRYVARFMGGANVFEGKVDLTGALHCEAAGCTLRTTEMLMPGAALALRPERILLQEDGPVPEENAATGVLREVAYQGARHLCLVALAGGQTLRVELPAGVPVPPPGVPVAALWAPDALVPLYA